MLPSRTNRTAAGERSMASGRPDGVWESVARDVQARTRPAWIPCRACGVRIGGRLRHEHERNKARQGYVEKNPGGRPLARLTETKGFESVARDCERRRGD